MRRRPFRAAVALATTLVVAGGVIVAESAAAPPATAATAATASAAAATAAAAAATTTAAAATTAAAMRQASAASLYGAGQYRSPTSEAAKAATALATTDPAGARAASTIAQYPVATWLGEWAQGATLTKTIDTAVAGAAQTGTTAVFVTYAIPSRDCGGYSAGGFDETTYDAWVDQVVARVAGKRAAVIVEPDSLAMLSNAACSTTLDQQRYRILAREVAAFTAAGVPAYLDAGNSNWVPAATMAARLNSAGVQNARGFFTNVANYYPTAQEQAYAQKVSAATGNSHYVIDTSRNGQGWRGTWCNGPGAGLGTSPRVATDGTALDALLWVKTPGASDGTCNGAPAAGKWYSAFAQALVANAVLGVPAAALAPQGAFESLTGTVAALRIRGWAFDEDDPTHPVTVRATVDGVAVGAVAAAASRPDVDTAYGVGAPHGFDVTVPATEGTRKVCVTAVDVGTGPDTALGCRTATVYRHDPYGQLDSVSVRAGGIGVVGWAFDADQPSASTSVAITVDGRTARTLTANGRRADVDGVWHTGTAHGYTGTVPGGAGKHTVCAVAKNVGSGTDRKSTCRSVTVPAAAPAAHRDSVRSSAHRRVTVRGWAFDRDATGSAVTVRVSVDGKAAGSFAASGTRTDVDAAYAVGTRHGLAAVLVAPSGRRTVCMTAFGIGKGGNTSLGCTTLTVR